jgi:hypothetical protein
MSDDYKGWQPIETAPRDGTEVIGWDGHSRVIMWCGSSGKWQSSEGREQPTLWLPLPTPPATEETP